MLDASQNLWALFKALGDATQDADKAICDARGDLKNPSVCLALDQRRIAYEAVEDFLDLYFDMQDALVWEARSADAE